MTDEKRTCQICTRNQVTDRLTCSRCQTRINMQLTDILEFYALAGDALIPGQSGGGRSTERPLGVRVDALDFICGFSVVDVLESWEKEWRDHYKLAPYGPATALRNAGQPDQPKVTLFEIVRFLQIWLDNACRDHPAIDDFASEVKEVHGKARNAAGITHRQAWTVTCPADTDNGDCRQPLKITGEDFDTTVTCRSCRTIWTVQRLMRVAVTDPNSDIWCAPDDAADYLGVHPGTLRKWAGAGKISRRHGLYSLSSIRHVIAQGVSA